MESLDTLALVCKSLFDHRVVEQRREIERLRQKISKLKENAGFDIDDYCKLKGPHTEHRDNIWCMALDGRNKICFSLLRRFTDRFMLATISFLVEKTETIDVKHAIQQIMVQNGVVHIGKLHIEGTHVVRVQCNWDGFQMICLALNRLQLWDKVIFVMEIYH